MIIGLTGGIASGKSTVSKCFREKGALIIDADTIAHRVIERGRPAYKKIVRFFGPAVLNKDNSINRKFLARIVFSSPQKLKKLNKFIHPEVIKIIKEKVNKRKGITRAIVIDAPLLIESGLHKMADRVVVVTCPLKTQIERVTRRDRISRTQALLRIKQQMPVKEKIRFADEIIDGRLRLKDLREKIEKIFFVFLCLFFFAGRYLFAGTFTTYDLKIKEGISLKERLDYPGAIRVFEEAVTVDPARYEAYYYLADIYEREGTFDAAIASWHKCFELDPEGKKGKEAKEHFIFLSILKGREEALKNVTLPERLDKMHFIIFHKNYLYASSLVFKAESAYKKILHDLGLVKLPFWDRFKCVMLLFPEKESYISFTSGPPWSGGLAQYSRFLFATYEGSPGLEEKILPHELTHLALQMFMGSDTRIPLWLNEGMAKYEEDGSRDYLSYIKQSLMKKKYFPFSELFAMADYPEDDIALFYAQSASIIYYLKDKNISSLFPQILSKIKDGTGIDRALRDVYQWKFQKGVSDLEEKWREELE